MPNILPFELWLEFEHTQPSFNDDLADDFCNIQVRLPDGRRYALNVWTFRFLDHSRLPSPNDDSTELCAEYIVAPDLFVERLDRPTLKRVIGRLLARGEMRDVWLCPQE